MVEVTLLKKSIDEVGGSGEDVCSAFGRGKCWVAFGGWMVEVF